MSRASFGGRLEFWGGKVFFAAIALTCRHFEPVTAKSVTLSWGLKRPVQYQQVIAAVGDKLQFELLDDDEVVEEIDGLNSWLSCDFASQHAEVVQSTNYFKTERENFVVEVELLSPGTLYFASPLDCRGTYECDFLFGMTNCDVGVAVIVDVKGKGDGGDDEARDPSECYDVRSGECETFSAVQKSPPRSSYELLLVTEESYCQMECIDVSNKCRGYQYQSESGICSLMMEAPSGIAPQLTSDDNEASVCGALRAECAGGQ